MYFQIHLQQKNAYGLVLHWVDIMNIQQNDGNRDPTGLLMEYVIIFSL